MLKSIAIALIAFTSVAQAATPAATTRAAGKQSYATMPGWMKTPLTGIYAAPRSATNICTRC